MGCKRLLVWSVLAAYVATIVAANWFIGHVGTQETPAGPHVIPVGFGLEAPSGVLWVGIALVIRDVLQLVRGRPWSIAAMLCGTALSYLIAPSLAFASAAAFLLSETADLLVYTPLVRGGRVVLAVLASSTVGVVVDSAVFLLVAFGSLEFIQGLIVGKLWSAIFATTCIRFVRGRCLASYLPRPHEEDLASHNLAQL